MRYRWIELVGVIFVIFSGLSCKHKPQTVSKVDALPHARNILGPAKPWIPIKLDPEVLKNSISERRKTGWKIMEQALRRVTVINPKTGEAFMDLSSNQPLTIPLWQTWYEVNEFQEVFEILYWDKLNDSQRAAGEAPVHLVEEAMAQHHEKKLLKKWTKPLSDGRTRFEKLLGQLSGPQEISALNGVSGRGHTLYSPGLIKHFLLNYAKVKECRGMPPDFTTGNTDQDFATCMNAPFPEDAVAIKATWNTVTSGLATFDTTAHGMAQTLSQPKPTWKPSNTADTLVFPGAEQIYTSNTFVDDQRSPAFSLTGLHVLTKDIAEWMWVSLWWSTTPDQDFGEDRPVIFKNLGPVGAEAVWDNYKMCVTSTFDEGDPDMKRRLNGLKADALPPAHDTSLDAALLTTAYYTQPHTFCSNPYIESTPGVARTNCIGCHQHAGPLASNARQVPDLGQLRKSFMTDFLWSFDGHQESFQRSIRNVIESGSPF